MPLAREGRPGGFRGWVGCGGGSDSPSRAGPRGWGERSRGGSGRPAVSGGCRTQFQLETKKKKLNCPAPSNRCVSRRKLGSRSRSFSPLSCPPRVPAWVPAVGPGKVKARRVQPAGEALVARGEEPGFLHSASPPPLGAHRRLLLRPGGAPLRRRRSWRLRSGRGLCCALPLGSAEVSRRAGPGSPGARGGHSGSEQTSGGAGGVRGRARVRNPPPLRPISGCRGEAGGGRRACPPGWRPHRRRSEHARPAPPRSAGLPRRRALPAGVPSSMQARADPPSRGRWPQGLKGEVASRAGTPFLSF